MGLAFIGILGVVNYLIYQNPKRWDLTENQQFTLAPETLDTLDSLPQPVNATAFFTQRTPSDTAEGLLDQYKFKGDGQFDYQFINPEADPVAAQQAEITRDGTVVLRMGERQERVTIVSERELTAALIRLLSPGSRAVYFLGGHGEYNPEELNERAYSQAKLALEGKNYTVQTLNLLAANQIPDDAEAIVIAGPQQPVSEGEVEQLKEYVANGGALVVMEEPLPLTEFGDRPDPLAEYLSSDWGIQLGQDMVVDLTSNQPFIAVANQYGSHLITEKMQGVVSIFPTSRSVVSGESQGDKRLVELVLTANQSWAETDLDALTNVDPGGQGPQINPDEGVDLMGPVSLAVAGESNTNSARVVVFGDADFANDTFYSQFGNGDLFVNAVDWATEQEDLINLTPKESTNRLLIPPQPYAMNLILLGTIFVIPGIVLLSGIGVWIQRRRRG
jgi:ABC-type uncharacterized transport system involved in gliding motility auxiliary subunit